MPLCSPQTQQPAAMAEPSLWVCCVLHSSPQRDVCTKRQQNDVPPIGMAWLLSYVHRAVMQMDAKGNGTVAKASGGQRWEDDALRAFYQAYHSLGAKWAEVSML